MATLSSAVVDRPGDLALVPCLLWFIHLSHGADRTAVLTLDEATDEGGRNIC